MGTRELICCRSRSGYSGWKVGKRILLRMRPASSKADCRRGGGCSAFCLIPGRVHGGAELAAARVMCPRCWGAWVWQPQGLVAIEPSNQFTGWPVSRERLAPNGVRMGSLLADTKLADGGSLEGP